MIDTRTLISLRMPPAVFTPIKGSIPADVDKITVRPADAQYSEAEGDSRKQLVMCYRHFVVQEDPAIPPKDASFLIPLLPRPEGLPPGIPTFVSFSNI